MDVKQNIALCIIEHFFHRSESPSQAFIITLVWLSIVLKDIPPDKWSEVVISYNMYHLDGLKAAQKKLPMPAPYCDMWKKVTKVCNIHT